MMRKARVAVAATAGVCLAAASVLALAGCNSKAPANSRGSASSSAGSAVRVETVLVTREDLKRVSEATPAELLPYERTDLYAKVSGFLKEIRADYGDPVKKDEVLAVIAVPEMEKEFEQKKALVERAEAAINQAQEALRAADARVRTGEAHVTEAEAGRTRAQADLYRWNAEFVYEQDLVRKKVLDQQGLDVTRNQLESAKAAREEVESKVRSAKAALDERKAQRAKARADVRVAEANLLVARADRDEVQEMLSYTKVVAPYDGVVTRRNLHTGAFLNPKSGEQPLLTVMRTDKLRVIVDVPEKDARFLSKDNTVQVDLDALPGKQFAWKISRLAPVLGSGKKVRVEVEIPNPAGTLYAGMYGHASVILQEKLRALTVPVTCLGKDDKGAFVWLAADGKAKQQRVALGLNDGKKVEIVSGLNGTEEIICSGKNTLQEGQPVRAQKPGSEGKK